MGGSRQPCQQSKPDGRKCHAHAIGGSNYCFFHDPEKSAERQAARRAGGSKHKVAVLSSSAPEARLLDARDVVKLLAETINQVRRGEIDPKIANAVGYLGGLLLKALHETELETRLATLEEAIRRPPTTPEFILGEDEEHLNQVRKNGNS